MNVYILVKGRIFLTSDVHVETNENCMISKAVGSRSVCINYKNIKICYEGMLIIIIIIFDT